MGHKVTIGLIWLALPLAALLLLRIDYERYEQELASQLEYANARKDVLLRYSELYDNRGREVLTINDSQSRIIWEERFKEIGAQLEAEEQKLDDPSLTHYPHARKLLDGAAGELDEQRDNLRDAGRLQDAYAKSQGNVDLLHQQADEFYYYAKQAEYFGWVDQFLAYEDALARVESQLNQRQRRGFELSNELTLAMTQANSHRTGLRTFLAELPEGLTQDQGRTYREDLTQRFSSFDLVDTIKTLVNGPGRAQAAAY